MSDRPHPAGFTLLELIVAISLLGLILLGLTGGLRFGVRAWRSQEDHVARYAEVNAVQSALRGLITGARGFSGTSASVSFIGTLPESLNAPGLFDTRIGLDAEGKVVLAWKPRSSATRQQAGSPGESQAGSPGEQTELIGNVEGLDFAYFTAEQGNPAAWHPTTGPAAAPLLIRVEVRFRSGDPRRWPELVVAPRVNPAPALGAAR